MNALTKQERYRRRVLQKAKLYDRMVEELSPLRKSHKEIERIFAEIDNSDGREGQAE